MRTVHYAAMDRPLSVILGETPPEAERLVLCGPYLPAAQMRRWLVAEGWEVRPAVIDRHGAVHATCMDGARRLSITGMGVWLPGETIDPRQARLLLAHLCDRLRLAFHVDGAMPLRTPCTLGRHLWRMTGGALFDPLDEELQALIRANSTPNRREVLALPELVSVPWAEVWDMRFAYGALAEHLPIGPADRTTGGELLPSTVGLVRVAYRVPADWQHVGLLLQQVPGGWAWPADPGYEGETWCDASEARLAVRHGWTVTLRETIALREGLPCDTWARRIARLYCTEQNVRVRRMLRRVLMCTIGGFRGWGLRREVLLETGDELGPAAFLTPSPAPTTETAVYAHPEWCAAVWARVRYRMAKSMLSLPRAQILGVYGDNLWTTGEVLDPDRGRIGDLRRKGTRVCGPIVAPRSETELHRLTKRAEGPRG